MKTIVYAEDEPNLRLLVTSTLEDPRFDLVACSDGTEALAAARAHRPDLLVLDWMMPGLTGLDVVRTLRGEPGFGETPVIMLTARSQDVDRAAATAAGVTHYLTKPFSPLELLDLVESIAGDA